MSDTNVTDLFDKLIRAQKPVGLYDGHERGLLLVAMGPPEVIAHFDLLLDVILLGAKIDPRCQHMIPNQSIHADEPLDSLFDMGEACDGILVMREPIVLICSCGEVPALSYLSVHPPRHHDILMKFFGPGGRAHELGLPVLPLS